MTIQEAVDNLLKTYGKYGATREMLIELIQSGIMNYGLSVKSCYNGVRMMLGKEYNEREWFTASDLSEMLGITEEEVIKQAEQLRAEALAAGADPNDYAIEAEKRKFIVQSDNWTS